eukprot:GSMAST32.ASY1.ANO1.2389.1 assembled CDS
MVDAANSRSYDLIPEQVQRMLGDRSYDRRKSAALTVETTIKSLTNECKTKEIEGVIKLLSDQFTRSASANHRKGGLIGLAAVAIVIHCFQDPETRALFNIAKVARQRILGHFNEIFAGLCELYSDVDVDVKNGAQLLDRFIKEIVTESDTFAVEHFIPLLQRKLKTRNPYIRQLLVGWVVLLDSVPFINMLDFLPNFLEGLFNMLSDDIREIRQQADQALCEFLQEIKQSDVSTLELSPIVEILVEQCNSSRARFNRLYVFILISNLFIFSYEILLKKLYATLLNAVAQLLADEEREIRENAEQTNEDLLLLVKESETVLNFKPLLLHLKSFLSSPLYFTFEFDFFLFVYQIVLYPMKCLLTSFKFDVFFHNVWVSMLLEKDSAQVLIMIDELFPIFTDEILMDASDEVVLLDLEVDDHFERVLTDLIRLFRTNRNLLEQRGSLIIRNLCLHLNSEKIYTTIAKILLHENDLPFARIIIQSLREKGDGYPIFPSELINEFAQVDVTLGFLMQIDKLVQLLESPIFLQLRLQLLNGSGMQHVYLMKSMYGLLMILPQSSAFETLRNRLTSVSTLFVAVPQCKNVSSKLTHRTYVPELLKCFSSMQVKHVTGKMETFSLRSHIKSNQSVNSTN